MCTRYVNVKRISERVWAFVLVNCVCGSIGKTSCASFGSELLSLSSHVRNPHLSPSFRALFFFPLHNSSFGSRVSWASMAVSVTAQARRCRSEQAFKPSTPPDGGCLRGQNTLRVISRCEWWGKCHHKIRRLQTDRQLTKIYSDITVNLLPEKIEKILKKVWIETQICVAEWRKARVL